MDKNILDIKLADLTFTTESRRNQAVKCLLEQIYPEKFKGIKLSDKTTAEWSFRLSVGDVVNANNQSINWGRAEAWLNEFRDIIVALGATQLDWIALPKQTVTNKIKIFKDLDKDELKKRSVILLDTLSISVMNLLKEKLGKQTAEEITIGDLLDISEKNWRTSRDINFWSSILKTQQKLRKIGFLKEDGIFLQEAKSGKFIKGTMRRRNKFNQKKRGKVKMVIDAAAERVCA